MVWITVLMSLKEDPDQGYVIKFLIFR